jgi:hypothetical protein
MRKRRADYLDSRITDRSVELFQLGRRMLRDGIDPRSEAWIDTAFALNKELKLPPWAEMVLDLEAYRIPPEKLESANWRLPRQLHRQLAAAHRGRGAN